MKKAYSRREFIKSSLMAGGLGVCSVVINACAGVGGATPTPAAGVGKSFQFDLEAGDTVAFNKDKLSAEAGSKITVTFANKSSNNQYNWVLSQPGKMLRVVSDGQQEGEGSGYVKQDDQNVIAHTKLLKPGETDTISFDAPSPGDYPYFCTFPGYYARLNGTLTIK